MAYDVFISYSDSDREIAEALAEALKVEGVSATLGPDGARGKAREEAAGREIDASRTLLLVFSWNARGAERLRREVERAAEAGTPVVSFHADKTPLDPGLEYYVAPAHRIASSPASAERSAARLVETVKRLIPGGEAVEGKGSTGYDTGVYGVPDTGELSEFKRRMRREGGAQPTDAPATVYTPRRRRSWTSVVIAALAILFVLYALGAQFGFYTVGVMTACVAGAYLLVGLAPDRRRSPMFPALVLTFGHLLWFASGLLILVLAGGVEAVLSNPLGLPLDAAIFSVFFVWLIARPGVVSGIANIALSLFFMYGGLASVSGEWAAEDLVSGVALHAILYVATIIALAYGVAKLWKPRSSS